MLAPNTNNPVAKNLTLADSPKALALTAFALLVAGFCCLGLDLPITRFFKATDPPGDIQRLIDFSEGFGHGLGVALIIFTVGLLAHSWKQPVIVAIYAFGAGLLSDVAKLLMARHRPYHHNELDGPVAETFIGWLPWLNDIPLEQATSSLPSAHAATAFGMAIALSRLFPRGQFVFFLVAILCGLQRIECYAHFTSDVVWGAAIAFGLASLLAHPSSIPSRLMKDNDREEAVAESTTSRSMTRGNADLPQTPAEPTA